MAFAIDQLSAGYAKSVSQSFSRLDVISNNIANIGTPGFKVERVYPGDATSSSEYANGESALLYVDYSQGVMQQTGNPLDVAIQGEGFFVVQTKEGSAYTRKGNFTINRNSQLVTQSGDNVLGENGPIQINGKSVNIDNEGTISVEGTEVGKLKVAKFDNPQKLVRQGGGLFMDPGTAGLEKVDKPEINSGHLELANVNAIQEMVEMIDIQRSFESYQKTIQTIQDMDKLSTGRIGRLA
ncbi:MAG: flagellar basal-body rod protein FlgF [Syntrophales bacterium LBB04]|nr:flagellar basal-body rod protein FlgF [Syntrophales bacterium LBB04]